MNTLLFDKPYYDKYYNCSGRSYEEWKALGHPNFIIGIVYCTLGIIFLALLLPFMVVFVKSDVMKFSCYKIMFFIGIIDSIQIPIAGFYCAYASAVGMIYCMAPLLNYVIGSVAIGTWAGSSSLCMLLAINRCIDIINPRFGAVLFSGKKTYLWMMIPFVFVFVVMFFYITIIFNSNLYAFFFDPFFGIPERHGVIDAEHYPAFPLSVYNITVVVVLFCAYSFICVYITIKSQTGDTLKITRMQKQTFIQSFLVCSATFIAALLYVYMQFFPPPLWIVITAEICWQTSHGAAGISYAFFNKTLRKEAKKIFCGDKHKIGDRTQTRMPPTSDNRLSNIEY